jgi:glycosyltransferase involved in cell wall biosynthesis
MNRKKIIGTKYSTYAEKRNIALPFKDYEVKRVIDLYVLLSAAHLRLKGKPKTQWINLHDDFNLNDCIGFHFWNATSFSKKPWITTLELPFNESLRLEHLARSQCKQVFCLSSWVMDCQKNFLQKSPHRDDILPKLKLLHPSQNSNITESDLISKNFTETLKFIFVGRDFFRKGGYECVKAFSRIIELGLDAELTIVSQLTTNDYPVPAPQENLEHALKLIENSQGKIKVSPEISQQEVFNLIANSHIGLLPTYNDSYGYSVLEFFSYGCPVITTNVLALPEINHSDRGWIIEMPLVENEDGIKLIDRNSPEKNAKMSNLLTELLVSLIQSILEDRSQLNPKSVAALRYIEQNHNINENIQIIEQAYNSF